MYKINSAVFESSWLIQRLGEPRNSGLLGVDNPFAFGGGLKNGGLSDEAMNLIRDIWSFDYMGAAEFEFGSVPAALSHLAENPLVKFEVDIPLAKVPQNWRDKSKEKPVGTATLYVLCPARYENEVRDRIVELATTNYSLKAASHITNSLRPFDEWDTDTLGWLELDNGFLFFKDKEMWEKACKLFGVE